MSKIKVAAVSYLNTKPLLYGIERSQIRTEMELLLDYPSQLAEQLMSGAIDMALLPVAVIPDIPNARIVSDYGIAADGVVASVSIFSQVPLEQIETLYLDYQSRTSVRLAQLLFEKHWKQTVEYKPATEHYIDYINGTTAGVIIGDRAFKQQDNFEYIYDLSEAWKAYTGLPFVFAAWVANKDLPTEFLEAFNKANALGLSNIDAIVEDNPFPYCDLKKYYTDNIHYYLDEDKKKGLQQFLELIQA
ncbi:MAG: menaquinone biosynthesis protein [Flavipsychrobacter sp.]